MKGTQRKKLLLVHAIISPYRLPLFQELSRHFDLEVVFLKAKTDDRKWSTSLEGYSFKWKLLGWFAIGSFIINHTMIGLLARKRYDVYMISETPQWAFAYLVTLLFAKLRGKPLVLWSGTKEYYRGRDPSDQEYNSPKARLYWWLIDRFKRFLYSHADAYVAYCPMSRDFLRRRGSGNKSIFMGGQVMPETLLPRPDGREDGPSFDGRKVVLNIGYLREAKGVDILIEAFKDMHVDGKLLVLVGSGDHEERLRRMAAGRGDILFVGYKEGAEKAAYYMAADLFVLPTFDDAWGLVLNEALYYGIPVVTTTEAGAHDMVGEEGVGEVVRPGDVKGLRKAMERLLNDDGLRAAMSEKARRLDILWDVKKGARPLLDAVEHVLERSR